VPMSLDQSGVGEDDTPASLSPRVGEDAKRTVADYSETFVLDDYSASSADTAEGRVPLKEVSEEVEAFTESEDLENLLKNTLKPKEREVLRLRYGLDDGRFKSLRAG